MLLSGAAIVIVLAGGLVWFTRGFFSGFIHLLCVLVAAALALAFWEPIGYAMLESFEGQGAMASAVWSIALGIPFALILAILRAITDYGIVKGNADAGPTFGGVGGGLCGVLAGVVVAGMLGLSMSSLRIGRDSNGAPNYLGYSSTGSVIRTGGMWVPFDKLVASFYGTLSERALRTGHPLARWHPAMHEFGPGNRMSPYEGKGRNSIKVDDFAVNGRFTVGKGGNLSADSLLRDWMSQTTQSVTDLDGNPFPDGSHIEGVIVNFKAGSKEKDGRTSIGAGQVRMVLESEDGRRIVVHPIAVTSQADPSIVAANLNQGSATTTEAVLPVWGRWRFDGADIFIASVGGGSEAIFGLEFLVPPGYQPLAIYIKGVRTRLDEGTLATPKHTFASASARDAFLVAGMTGASGALPAMGGGVATTTTSTGSSAPAQSGMDVSGASVIGDGQPFRGGNAAVIEGVRVTHTLPDRIQKGQEGGLEIDDKNVVVGGEMRTTNEIMRSGTAGLEKSLIIDQLQTSTDTVLVWIEMPASGRRSILGKALSAAEQLLPPTLVDTQGERYQPVGYMYKDETEYRLRFTPGDPITAMAQIPALSRSRPSQRLELLFRVSFGREIRYLSLGNKVVIEYNPPWPANVRQVNRR